MPETPAGRKAETRRSDAGGPQLRRELAQAAATLELSELDTSKAHVGELLAITFAHGRDRGRPYSFGELHAMAAGELPDFPQAPGPEALKVLRRVGASARCAASTTSRTIPARRSRAAATAWTRRSSRYSTRLRRQREAPASLPRPPCSHRAAGLSTEAEADTTPAGGPRGSAGAD
jgi:hypothetical protein